MSDLDETIYNCNKILLNSAQRWSEIYKIINIVNNKFYIGQTVSHVLNHNKYRPYGYIKRFNSHISEAFSNKKHQSIYLNNAIKKYGKENFIVELIEKCSCDISDEKETYYIKLYNSLYPNGYNLKNGGTIFKHTAESRKKLSISMSTSKKYILAKYERFKDVNIINEDIKMYIKPLKRNNIQYGWYVYVNNKKADFGGVHIDLKTSYNTAYEFLLNIKNKINVDIDT